MAKNLKRKKEGAAPEGNPGVPAMESNSGNGSGKSLKSAAGKKAAAKNTSAAAKPALKSRSTAPRKSAATGKRKAPPGSISPVASEHTFSDEDIRIRAYFIAERRMKDGAPGDSAHDWIEARRQLQEEAAERA